MPRHRLRHLGPIAILALAENMAASLHVRFGDFELDEANVTLLRRGKPVQVPRMPFLCLASLIRAAPGLVSREELVNELFKDNVPIDASNCLHVTIGKVRHILGENREWVETVRQFGYRFTGPVEKREERPSLPLSMLTTHRELVGTLDEVVRGAKTFLVCLGHRSHDTTYLSSIEDVVAKNPNLVHYRILFGRPVWNGFAQHLKKLVRLRPPKDRSRGRKTIYISHYSNTAQQQEVNMCASDAGCVIILPSVSALGTYDTGLFIKDSKTAGKYRDFAHMLHVAGNQLVSIRDIEALGIEPDPAKHE